jgi:hypothetical protein
VSVLIAVGCIVTLCGVLSIVRRGKIQPGELVVDGSAEITAAPLDPVAVAITSGVESATWRAGLTADDEDPPEPVDAG